MRIVLATPLYPPEIGGPATYAKLLFEGLPAHGVEVELVKFSDVRRFPKMLRHYLYFRSVLKAARTADLVLALDPVSVGLPVMKAAKKAKKPFVVKIVGDYAWEQGRQRFGITDTLDEFVKREEVPLPVRILRRVETRVASSAARVIVPSQYLKGIVESWGVPSEKISVIYNAVPVEAVGVAPRSLTELPQPFVATAGRLVPWKHMDGIIDALFFVKGASLAIIGDGPLRMPLERHAQEKLKGRLAFTGLLPHKDTLAAIQAAHVFVLNSSYEGLSHLLIEALSLGVPCIATRVGGNPEVVVDGKNGLLIPANDTSALAHALTRLLEDTDLRARMSEEARESAKRFSLPKMLSSTTELLKTI